jgi:hypothetical protein
MNDDDEVVNLSLFIIGEVFEILILSVDGIC